MNPLSAIFAAVSATRNALYDRGVFRSKHLKAPVVSVGNISVGGTGKTPFAIALGELLKARGIDFDVLSRGYRRDSKGVQVVSDTTSPKTGGDEPVLIARRLGVPVIVAAQRADAGHFAERSFGPRLHLLDDGFQHRQLARDFDIVLLTPSDLEDTLLPIGRLREPLSALHRADAVVVPDDFVGILPGYEGPVWHVRRSLKVDTKAMHPLAFCGIARPQQFFSQLSALGVNVAHQIAFRDHHSYTPADLARLKRTASEYNADGFITTEKDMIKLAELGWDVNVAAARLQIEIVNADGCVEQMLTMLRRRCPDWFSR